MRRATVVGIRDTRNPAIPNQRNIVLLTSRGIQYVDCRDPRIWSALKPAQVVGVTEFPSVNKRNFRHATITL